MDTESEKNERFYQNSDKTEINEYWQRYKRESGDTASFYNSYYYFCNNEKDANELAELVIAGRKRATASNAYVYEKDGDPLPKQGDLNIITDFNGAPKCIIKTTRVDVIPFKEVSDEFAAMEGEGDGSLEYWRSGHIYYFTMECEELGLQFTEDMPVVCEQFEVVYK